MKAGSIALVLSALALGAAVVALTREGESAPPGRAPVRTDRVAALELQVAELTRELESLKASNPRPDVRDTLGLPLPARADAPGEGEGPKDFTEDDPTLKAVVDLAVDRKTEQVLKELRAKENKKPPIDLFASMLDLTRAQRVETERVVVEGQRELHRILEIRAADGTDLMEQLVEIAARGMAEPGKDHGWSRWLARVVSEKMPGTDTTYAARIEAVKNSMRASFKRNWSEAQYVEFQQWGVDPTEIQGVPGSPNEALVERITTRARMLGALIPGDR